MKGDPKIIEHLNIALRGELSAIHQYLLHARMLDDWGMTKMAEHEHNEAMEEMGHAKRLIDRIILLGGKPDMEALDKLQIGHDVESVIKGDLKLEIDGIKHYREAAKIAGAAEDFVSRKLFISILDDEEGHEDFLNTQLEMIERMGLQNYIMLQSAATTEQEAG